MDSFKGCKRISRPTSLKYVKVITNRPPPPPHLQEKNEKEKERNGTMAFTKEEYYSFLCGCRAFRDLFEISTFTCFERKHPLKIFPGFCIATSSMKMWNIHIMIIKHKLKELHEVYVVLMTPFNN